MLTELLLAHQKGWHYVWCNREDFNSLKKYFKNNTVVEPILYHLSSDLNEGKSIMQALDFYIYLDFEDKNSDVCSYHKELTSCFLRVYYKTLLKLESYGNKICFLSENLTDIAAYTFLANSYKNSISSLKNLTLSLDAYNGGGHQTSICFESNKLEKITLCIVDSDKKYYKDELKKTARDDQEVKVEKYEIAKDHILDCHEVENLFHPKIWEMWHMTKYRYENVNRGIIFDEEWLNNSNVRRDFVRYIDYKKGLKFVELKDHTNRNFKQYWDKFYIERLKGQDAVEETICIPFGDKALKSLVECLKKDEGFLTKVHEILYDSNNDWYNLWKKYARIICSWAIAPRKSTVS